MNREILFRGKRKDNGDWVEGFYEPYKNKEGCFIGEHETNFTLIPKLHAVYSETVGQYTGLCDKNGTKIFEGDILQLNDNPKDIVKVVFGEFSVIDFETEIAVESVIGWHCEGIIVTPLDEVAPFCYPFPLTDYYINRCNAKVIGNIHDNPGLLKG